VVEELSFLRHVSPITMTTEETMHATDVPSTLPDALRAELQEALDDLSKGVRRPEKMQEACERMDRMREANRKLFGEQNIAVDLIRQTRDA